MLFVFKAKKMWWIYSYAAEAILITETNMEKPLCTGHYKIVGFQMNIMDIMNFNDEPISH